MSEPHEQLLHTHAARILHAEGFDRVYLNPMQSWGKGERVDALGVATRRAGEVLAGDIAVLDAKMSREDVRADSFKPWRFDTQRGIGQWRYILSDPHVVTIADLTPRHDGWGLVDTAGTTIVEAQRFSYVDFQTEKALLARLLPDSPDAKPRERKGGRGKLSVRTREYIAETLEYGPIDLGRMAKIASIGTSISAQKMRNNIIHDLEAGLLPGVTQDHAGAALRLAEHTPVGKD